jgi:hypothetical protein
MRAHADFNPGLTTGHRILCYNSRVVSSSSGATNVAAAANGPAFNN